MTETRPSNLWDQRYAAEDYLFGDKPNAFLKRQKPRLLPGQKVLAVADGEGRNGVWLAEQGMQVISLDGSPVGQGKARRLAEARGAHLKFELADLTSWVFPESAFDLVVAIFIQFAGPELREHLFKEMKRALKPGGLLLVEGYRPEQLAYRTGGPPIAENLYTEDMLRNLASDFDILELTPYDAVIEEGTGHKGMSALIDLVARRPL